MIPCAAILAGGAGTRIQPVLGNLPKVLAPVAGRPFIFYLLDQLQACGIKLTVLCTGFESEKVRQTAGEWYKDMKLAYSAEDTPLGTGGALRKALPFFNTAAVLVMNGDSYCRASLKKFIQWFENENPEAGMLAAKTANPMRFGNLNWNAAGKVHAFAEKPAHAAHSWVNAGVYLFSKSILSDIPENKQVSLEKRLFPVWVRRKRLSVFPVTEQFLDIGTPDSYHEADAFLNAAVHA